MLNILNSNSELLSINTGVPLHLYTGCSNNFGGKVVLNFTLNLAKYLSKLRNMRIKRKVCVHCGVHCALYYGYGIRDGRQQLVSGAYSSTGHYSESRGSIECVWLQNPTRKGNCLKSTGALKRVNVV